MHFESPKQAPASMFQKTSWRTTKSIRRTPPLPMSPHEGDIAQTTGEQSIEGHGKNLTTYQCKWLLSFVFVCVCLFDLVGCLFSFGRPKKDYHPQKGSLGFEPQPGGSFPPHLLGVEWRPHSQQEFFRQLQVLRSRAVWCEGKSESIYPPGLKTINVFPLSVYLLYFFMIDMFFFSPSL